MESFVKRFAARAERFSGIEVGGGWPFALVGFLGAALLLSCPFVVGVYAVLALGFALLPRLGLPLLLLLGSVASVIWMGLAALGLAVSPSKSLPEAHGRRGRDASERPSLSWTFHLPERRAQERMSVAPAEETVEDVREPEDDAGTASTVGERLRWAVLLSSGLPLGAAIFLVVFPPFFVVWLLSRGMARLAEGLRTAVLVAGFVLFLSGLCLQLWASF